MSIILDDDNSIDDSDYLALSQDLITRVAPWSTRNVAKLYQYIRAYGSLSSNAIIEQEFTRADFMQQLASPVNDLLADTGEFLLVPHETFQLLDINNTNQVRLAQIFLLLILMVGIPNDPDSWYFIQALYGLDAITPALSNITFELPNNESNSLQSTGLSMENRLRIFGKDLYHIIVDCLRIELSGTIRREIHLFSGINISKRTDLPPLAQTTTQNLQKTKNLMASPIRTNSVRPRGPVKIQKLVKRGGVWVPATRPRRLSEYIGDSEAFHTFLQKVIRLVQKQMMHLREENDCSGTLYRIDSKISMQSTRSDISKSRSNMVSDMKDKSKFRPQKSKQNQRLNVSDSKQMLKDLKELERTARMAKGHQASMVAWRRIRAAALYALASERQFVTFVQHTSGLQDAAMTALTDKRLRSLQNNKNPLTNMNNRDEEPEDPLEKFTVTWQGDKSIPSDSDGGVSVKDDKLNDPTVLDKKAAVFSDVDYSYQSIGKSPTRSRSSHSRLIAPKSSSMSVSSRNDDSMSTTSFSTRQSSIGSHRRDKSNPLHSPNSKSGSEQRRKLHLRPQGPIQTPSFHMASFSSSDARRSSIHSIPENTPMPKLASKNTVSNGHRRASTDSSVIPPTSAPGVSAQTISASYVAVADASNYLQGTFCHVCDELTEPSTPRRARMAQEIRKWSHMSSSQINSAAASHQQDLLHYLSTTGLQPLISSVPLPRLRDKITIKPSAVPSMLTRPNTSTAPRKSYFDSIAESHQHTYIGMRGKLHICEKCRKRQIAHKKHKIVQNRSVSALSVRHKNISRQDNTIQSNEAELGTFKEWNTNGNPSLHISKHISSAPELPRYNPLKDNNKSNGIQKHTKDTINNQTNDNSIRGTCRYPSTASLPSTARSNSPRALPLDEFVDLVITSDDVDLNHRQISSSNSKNGLYCSSGSHSMPKLHTANEGYIQTNNNSMRRRQFTTQKCQVIQEERLPLPIPRHTVSAMSHRHSIHKLNR